MGAILAGLSLAYKESERIKKNVESAKRLKIPWWQQGLISMVGPEISGAVYDRRVGRLDDLEAKTRNSTGVGGEAALKKAAGATREIMNQQLNQNINTINTDYGAAGRYASGARTQAILQAQNSSNFNLANVVNQMSLQESQFTRNLEEEHAWRQASLDAGQPSRASQVGDILQTGLSMYMQNPEGYNKMLGINKDSGMVSGTEYEPTLQEFNPLSEEIQTGYLHPNAGIMDILPNKYPTQKQLPSFLDPQQVIEKPVNQWIDEDFSNNVMSMPSDNMEFFSSTDNIKTLSNALSYVIINNLDEGELPKIMLEYSLTGDINKVKEWLIEKGVVLDGGSYIQSK